MNDMVSTTAQAFLGLTIGCAKCHDHKFDPIPQQDYYRLQAFFAGTRAQDDIALVPPAEREKYQQELHDWEEKTKDIRAEMRGLGQFRHRQRLVQVVARIGERRSDPIRFRRKFKQSGELRLAAAGGDVQTPSRRS